MTYTFISGVYSNASNTVVLAETEEAGQIIVSQFDDPDTWNALFDSDIEISPYVAVPVTVAPVTSLQGRRALRQAGLYNLAHDAVVASNDPDLHDSWEYAVMWHRTAPWITSMSAQLGFTDEQIDQLFLLAASMPNDAG